MNLPNLFPVPDDLSKAWRHQSDPVLGRSRPLCPTCREMKMVQPRTMMIPDDLKRSFEHLTSHRVDAALSVLAWRTGERALQTAHPGPQDGRLLPAAVGRLAHPAGGTGPFLARPAANRQDSQAASDQSICPRLSEGKQP
uniref:Uncharacterized protein n=1 Tax=Molossus molossus TaxID=27622 RepID=A0A7J8CPE8_MOLMO|nr:hypothetical protein HJG59_001768 [Molossus molossus]